MKVISWNILHGQPLPPPDPWMNLEQSRAVLKEASRRLHESFKGDDFIIGLQEVDLHQERSAGLHQVEELAQSLGAKHFAYAPAIFGTPGSAWRKAKRGEVKIFTESEIETEALDAAGPMYGIGMVTSLPVRKWHRCELGKSPVGVHMRFPEGDSYKTIYVEDENRVALAAELENGFTVIVTHLSFVPLANLIQYWRVLIWAMRLPGKVIIMGDLNLPWNIPQKFSLRRSMKSQITWPIWEPKFQLDYLLVPRFRKWAKNLHLNEYEIPDLAMSDHHPHGIDIQL